MNIPTAIAIRSINFYQKELSHKKKYHCAHGLLHQGLTCSEYSKLQIEKVGVLIGLKNTFFRLRDCYLASKKIRKLKAEVAIDGGNNQKQENSKKNQEIDSCTKIQIATDSACCFLTFWPW